MFSPCGWMVLLALAAAASALSSSSSSSSPRRLQRLHTELLGPHQHLPTVLQVEVAPAPVHFPSLKEAAAAWVAEGRSGMGWTVLAQEHVPDDPVARELRSEVLGYLLTAAVSPPRVVFVCRITSEEENQNRQANLRAFLMTWESTRETDFMAFDTTLFEIPPMRNAAKLLYDASLGVDGDVTIHADDYAVPASLAAGNAEPEAEEAALGIEGALDAGDNEDEKASTYERLHIGGANPDALTAERTKGQLERLREDLDASRDAVAAAPGRSRRRTAFGPEPVLLSELFQLDWARPTAVAAGVEVLVEHARGALGHRGSGPRAVQVLMSDESPSAVKLQQRFSSVDAVLEYLVTDQEPLLSALAPHRAEVAPVRQIYKTAGRAFPYGPAARFVYCPEARSLPLCFVDALSVADVADAHLATLVKTAVSFGVRGVVIHLDDLRRLQGKALGEDAASAQVITVLDWRRAEEDLKAASETMRSSPLSCGSLVLSVDPNEEDVEAVVEAFRRTAAVCDGTGGAGAFQGSPSASGDTTDDRAATAAMLERMFRGPAATADDGDEAGGEGSDMADARPLLGVHFPLGDTADDDEAAATMLKRLARDAGVTVVVCNRSVLRPRPAIDAAIRELGVEGLAWVNLGIDADRRIHEDPLMGQIQERQRGLSARQALIKWHTYQGDPVGLRISPPKKGETWKKKAKAFAEEVMETLMIDLRPEFVAALAALRLP